MNSHKNQVLEEFRQIPGVGRRISEDFWDMGLRSLNDLKNGNPEKLYRDLCSFKNCQVDRCMLYVFRCAVYYSSHQNHDPELLKWWSWKD